MVQQKIKLKKQRGEELHKKAQVLYREKKNKKIKRNKKKKEKIL